MVWLSREVYNSEEGRRAYLVASSQGLRDHFIVWAIVVNRPGAGEEWLASFLVKRSCTESLSLGIDGIHLHLTLFCDLIKDGRLIYWRAF